MFLTQTVWCWEPQSIVSLKSFRGEGDLEVKLLALCGEVMTFGNLGVYLFHLGTPLRPLTYREIKPQAWARHNAAL